MRKQLESICRTHHVIFTVVTLTLVSTFYLLSPNAPKVARATRIAAPAHQISLNVQPDGPLYIQSVSINSSTQPAPQIDLILVNKSTNGVSAYTLRYDAWSGESKLGDGTELSIIQSSDSILQPERSVTAAIDINIQQFQAITSIKVSVDFVEFTDGSTWGPDTSKSIERLAGQRTGARRAVRRFQRILESKNPNALLSAIETDPLGISPPPHQSSEWLDGFRHGVATIQGRLKQAYNRSDFAELKSALGRPIDALDALKRR